MRVELRERDLGELIGLTFTLAAERFGPLLIVLFLSALPQLVVQLVLGPPPDLHPGDDPFDNLEVLLEIYQTLGIVSLVGLFTFPIQQGACTLLIAAAFGRRAVTIGDALRGALRRYWALLALIFSFNLITTLGIFACLVPGIVFTVMFYLVVPVLLLEDLPWTQAFARSYQLLKERWWEVLVLWLVVRGIFMFVIMAATGLGQLLPPYAQIVTLHFTALLAEMMPLVAPVVAYYHFRTVKEAYDVQVLAELVTELGERGPRRG